ncbi:hypothetical protein LWC34_01875 [Kibdelosporangium philippinense]|uniref:Four-carbon acid sugar kinase nucleotide binding domain-containing protein n=1 Tax=Kibdelosporangium philippinense TaxID=211113 RepID=A0ABS8Z0V7_9PSEU|nr:nucleotide-binding domain containing protein [Kibdelosporangium philippinense]MCE7001596.1 hypothetical protein [Kibdelosporangium philippinense]
MSLSSNPPLSGKAAVLACGPSEQVTAMINAGRPDVPLIRSTPERVPELALDLVERGCRRLVVAGTEASHAVVSALGITSGTIGELEDAGVPWIHTRDLALLLVPDGFGEPELFVDATAT